MLKKFLLVALSLVMSFTLSACGEKTVERSGREALSFIDIQFKDFECVRNNVTTILIKKVKYY